jgi:hypothetical protein
MRAKGSIFFLIVYLFCYNCNSQQLNNQLLENEFQILNSILNKIDTNCSEDSQIEFENGVIKSCSKSIRKGILDLRIGKSIDYVFGKPYLISIHDDNGLTLCSVNWSCELLMPTKFTFKEKGVPTLRIINTNNKYLIYQRIGKDSIEEYNYYPNGQVESFGYYNPQTSNDNRIIKSYDGNCMATKIGTWYFYNELGVLIAKEIWEKGKLLDRQIF